MKNLNISENNTTNLFETIVGALNLAPTKISGQYKIVVDKNLKLWLDDYCGRRVPIDKSTPFLHQVANFLQIKNKITNNSVLRYGGFQKGNIKSWHIPFYFGSKDVNKLPKLFCLVKVPNETITKDETNKLISESNILNLVDLNEIGLTKIFEEINSEEYFDFPVFFNLEELNVKIFGYSINKGYPVMHTYSILNNLANQYYLDVFNNKLLNTYEENKIFFPRFLNIEFEFEYSNENTYFNNFMGFLSNYENFGQGNKVEITNDNFFIKTKKAEKLNWKQLNVGETYSLNKYENIEADCSINEIQLRNSKNIFTTYDCQAGDTISIFSPENEKLIDFVVKEKYIDKNSLFKSWINCCNHFNSESKKDFIFNVEKLDNAVKILITNNINIFDDENYKVVLPNKRSYKTENSEFQGIKENDVWLCGNSIVLSNKIKTVIINNEKYEITKIFNFENKLILRLNKPCGIKVLTHMFLYKTYEEEVCKLKPINFLSYYSKVTSEKQYDLNNYKLDLYNKFGFSKEENPSAEEQLRLKYFKEAFDNFNKNTQKALYQYVYETKDGELKDKPELTVEKHNENVVLNILFCSMGNTSYLTPNILNIDKQFWINNGLLNIDLGRNDEYRFNWFLINAECPNYLNNKIGSLRYMKTVNNKLYPQITSKLIRITDKLCETIFLGVKYQLPIEYENYQFAVYLNPNDKKYRDINYLFDVRHDEKLIMLSINKYIDFSDLIRGGNENNIPVIDLSFFINVDNLSNNTSSYLPSFKKCGLVVEPFYNHDFNKNEFCPLFNSRFQKNWITNYKNKNYICVRRLNNGSTNFANSLKVLFQENNDAEFYVYSTIEYQGKKYEYISMTFILTNVISVEDDYLWCEDIKIKFFDTKEIFLHKIVKKEIESLTEDKCYEYVEEILKIQKDTIVYSTKPTSNEIVFKDNHKIGTVLIDENKEKFELLLPDKIISLKEEYFDIKQSITTDFYGKRHYQKTVFKFPEFNLKSPKTGKLLTDNEIIEYFDDNAKLENVGYEIVPNENFDTTVYSQLLSLFNRNQVWKIIQNVLRNSLSFKTISGNYMRYYMDDFTIHNIINNLNFENNLIKINGTNDYSKLYIIDSEKNIVIWKYNNKDNSSLICREKTYYIPYFNLCNNLFDFQLDICKSNNSIWNLYDECFGGKMNDGTNISATGLWKEVCGNIVSTLFCKQEPIILTTKFEKEINYLDLLIDKLSYDKCIITNNNEKYIQRLDKNIQRYIIKSYAEMLLKHFYKVVSVKNNANQRLDYINYFITRTIKLNYEADDFNFKNIIITLKRI